MKKLKRVAVDNGDRIYAGDFQIYDRVVYKVGRQKEKSKMQKKNYKKSTLVIWSFEMLTYV